MKFVCENEKCGRVFEASRFWARYCSDACRQAAYEKRKKDSEELANQGFADSQNVSVSISVNKRKL
jgi:hypothetical protein